MGAATAVDGNAYDGDPVFVDGSVVLQTTGPAGGDSVDNLETGEYEFESGVVGSMAANNPSVQETDEGTSYYFDEIDRISEGEIANITIGFEEASKAALVLGDEDHGYVTQVEVDLSEASDNEAVLQFNAHEAATDEYAWSAYDEKNVSIDNVSVIDNEIGDDPLPAHSWDLSIGESFESEYELEEEFDRSVLVVEDHEGTSDVENHAESNDSSPDSNTSIDDDSDTEIDGDEDGIPGFGSAVAVVALFTTALLVLRSQQ
ncbi:hypothetical protein C446_12147 [Halobiforma nitratireducens JCM 10879]|uniref:PGF-CTERM sorting domain-containing protein n=1 Tax=Halobiforma nitratireducens JCM 10879 TaxID=1227454 RepID=M0LQ97_9EURY|nr:hypothetical protein C446_12147 [Halobiforma nitratireducens JCM 10879]